MLLSKEGQSLNIDGISYSIGMPICGTEMSVYKGLFGTILEIRDGDDKETENDGTDIVCAFDLDMSICKAKKIEERFSRLYGYHRVLDDIGLDYVILSPEMIRPVKRCRIHQIEPTNAVFTFAGYDALVVKGFSCPPASLYRTVFDGQTGTDDLEDIFRIFNISHPAGYLGRSLSVSDIVELYIDMDTQYFYCDTIGFKEISQWAKMEFALLRDKEIFQYGGYHFKPVRKFQKGEVDKPLNNDSRPWEKDAQYAMRNMRTDTELGLRNCPIGNVWSYDGFYAASGDSEADIFRCVENGRLYVPGENELFLYIEPTR